MVNGSSNWTPSGLIGSADTAEALPLDAANANRVAGSAVDIGAKESNEAPVLTGLDGGSTFTENGSATSLTATGDIVLNTHAASVKNTSQRVCIR